MTKSTHLANHSRKYNLLVAAKNFLFKEGLIALLTQWDKSGRITGVSDFDGIIEGVGSDAIDVLIIDNSIFGANGDQSLKQIRDANPTQGILLFTHLENDTCIREAMRFGIKGLLLKNSNFRELTKAIEIIAEGGEFYSPSISQMLLRLLVNTERSQNSMASHCLNPREIETLIHICNQLNTDEIADKMYISASMVKKHRISLLSKTESKSIAGLFLFAIRNNFIQLPGIIH